MSTPFYNRTLADGFRPLCLPTCKGSATVVVEHQGVALQRETVWLPSDIIGRTLPPYT